MGSIPTMGTMSKLNRAKELLRKAIRGASYDGSLSIGTEEKIDEAVDLIVEAAMEKALAKIEVILNEPSQSSNQDSR